MVKEILYRAADRVGVTVILVANQSLDVPGSPHIQSVQVPMGFDVADSHIAQSAAPGDLVITADIPLAAEVVAQGCMAINPRGELYTEEKNVLLKKKIDCSQYENADLRFNIYGDIKKDPENC